MSYATQLIAANLDRVFTEMGFPPGHGRHQRIAERFNVSRETVRKWLDGESVPKMSRLAQIVTGTAWTVDQVLTSRGHDDSASLRQRLLARLLQYQKDHRLSFGAMAAELSLTGQAWNGWLKRGQVSAAGLEWILANRPELAEEARPTEAIPPSASRLIAELQVGAARAPLPDHAYESLRTLYQSLVNIHTTIMKS